MTTGFRRLLFRLSGEDLAGGDDFGIHPGVISGIADEIREFHASDIRSSAVLPDARRVRALTASAQGLACA